MKYPMYEQETFIQVASDCPAEYGTVPSSNRDPRPAHLIQFDLLSQNPYRYSFEELLWEVYIRHKAISEEELASRGDELWNALFAKSHPCMRASMLPKKYGWGVHVNDEGKMAIYGRDSDEYRQFSKAGDGQPVQLRAVRSKRA